MYIERGREGERKSVCVREGEREREQESECVGVCVCERGKTPSQYSRAFPSPCSPSRNDFNETSHIHKENTFHISSPWIYSVTHIYNVTGIQREHLLYFLSLDVSIYPLSAVPQRGGGECHAIA